MTVGGIVTECKKIRTKSGSQMMFATLDDVEGQVEMLVFKADQAESAAIIAPDAIVVVRGRLDHKDRGETKLVVQEAERFEPDARGDRRARRRSRAVDSGPFEVPLDAGHGRPGPARRTEVGPRAPQGRGRRALRRPQRRRDDAAPVRRGLPGATLGPASQRARTTCSSASTHWLHSQCTALVFAVARP